MPSPYEVLDVDPDADEERVEAAYRERVKEVHPDHGGSARAFRSVRSAYEAVLAGEAAAPAESDPEVNPSDGEEAAAVGGRSTVEYLDYEAVVDHGWSLADPDLFEKARAAGMALSDHGEFDVGPDRTLLEAAEDCGFAWPFACRGGACANCAIAVVEGDCSMPADHILPEEQLDRGIRLSCAGAPTTREAKVVFNVKHLPELDDLRLPPYPFKQAHGSD